MALNDVLSSGSSGSSREVDCESFNRLVEHVEETLNSLGLTDARNTDEKNVMVNSQQVLEELVVTNCIGGRHINIVESAVGLRPPRSLDQVIPSIKVLLVGVNPVLEDCVGVGEHRLNVTDDKIEFSTTAFADSGTNRPDE